MSNEPRTTSVRTTTIRWARALVWLVYAWAIVTLVLLFLGFILLLFGANPEAGFVEFVYRSTQRAMAPFRGIFEPVQLTDQSVFDTSVLFAMIVYGFVALGLSALLDWTTNKLQQSRLHDREAAPTPSATSRLVNLSGPGGASASATLTARADGTSIELSASGLHATQSYGVWIETADGRRVTAGSFQPSHDGSVRVSLISGALLNSVRMFGVSPISTTGSAEGDLLATRLA